MSVRAPRLPPRGPALALLGLVLGLGLARLPGAVLLTPAAALLGLAGRRFLPGAAGLALGLAVLAPAPARPAGPGAPGERLEVEGTIAATRPPTRSGRWLRLGVGARAGAGAGTLEVRVSRAVLAPASLEPGARLVAIVRVRETLPGRAVQADALWARVLTRGRGPAAALARVRDAACERLDEALAPEDAGLARALLLGSREALSRADRARFRAAGQGHLLAVSGLHVGLLAGMFLWLAARAGLGQRARAWGTLGLVAVYVPLVGAPPSALRAGLGVALYQVGVLLDRRPPPLAVLCWVLLLLLGAAPSTLYSPALQLSAAAVLAILLLAPHLGAPWGRDEPLDEFLPRRPRRVRAAVAVSLAAHLGTAPWLAQHLGELSPGAWLVAVPSVLLTAVLVAAGFGLLLLAPLGVAATPCAAVVSAAAAGLRGLLDGAIALGVRALPAAAPGVVGWTLYLLGYALLLRARPRAGLGLLAAFHAWVLCGPAPVGEGRPADAAAYDAAPMPPGSPSPVTDLATLLPVGLALLGFAVVSARPLRWLSAGGAAAAFCLGLGATAALGLGALAALLAPFVVATLLGRLPGGPRHGARRLGQVAANGAPAAFGALLAAAGRPEAGLAALLGGLAALGADTCATEIGLRHGRRPFRLAGRRPLGPGESGAVTVAGLLATLPGAALAPLAYGLVAGFGPLLWAAGAAGVAGALLDSVLGSTLQFRGRDPATGRLTEARRLADGRRPARVAGLGWLGNDEVNLVSGLFAALLCVAWLGLALPWFEG